jgi:hypothetical protein
MPSPALSSTQDGQRLIVVSNRLPVTIKRGEDGKWSFSMSSGGLVSALSGCKKQMDFTWIGWPGELRAHAHARYLRQSDVDGYGGSLCPGGGIYPGTAYFYITHTDCIGLTASARFPCPLFNTLSTHPHANPRFSITLPRSLALGTTGMPLAIPQLPAYFYHRYNNPTKLRFLCTHTTPSSFSPPPVCLDKPNNGMPTMHNSQALTYRKMKERKFQED